MANCRWKRRNSFVLNYGQGRAAIGKPTSQSGPKASREATQAGESLNKMALVDQASKAAIEQMEREALMLDPILRALTARRREQLV